MADFAKGINIKEKTFDNGNTIINMSIDLQKLYENPINNERYINITIQRGKESGKLYAVINEYYQKNNKKIEENNEEIVQFGEESIPF